MNTFTLYDMIKQLENYIKYHTLDDDFEIRIKERIKKINEFIKEK